MRSRLPAVGAGLAALLLVGGGLFLGSHLAHSNATPPSAAPLATVTVERRTLQATTQVNGTLGYAPSYNPGAASAYTIGNGVPTQGGADETGLLSAYAQAQAGYDSAANDLDAIEHPKATDTAQAAAQLAAAQAALTSAQQSAAGPSQKELDAAKAQLAQAQAGLTQAQQAAQGPTPSQVAQAQATLAQAQANLLRAQDQAQGPTAAQTAQAQAQVTQAASALSADQAALASAAAVYTACAAQPSATPTPAPAGSPAPSASPTASPTAAPTAAPTPIPCDAASLGLSVQQEQAKVTTDEANLSAAQTTLASLSSPQAQAEAQANLTSAQQQTAAAQAALDALTSDQAKAQAQANLTSAQAAATAAQAALGSLTSTATQDETKAQLTSAQAQVHAAQAALYALAHPTSQQLTAANDQVSTARSQLDAAKAKLDAPSGVVTQLAQVGSTVKPGGVLYALDGSVLVVLLQGATPAWRTLHPGVDNGPDVKELEENLKALGYTSSEMKIDDHWDSQTTAAVKRWQKALGVPQTGVIPYGTVVFEPGPLRVTTDTAALGSTVQAGAAVLQATTTERVVQVALDPALQASIQVGDAVSITLPDGATTPGKVSYVASVATQSSGSGASAGSTPPPTIDVLVALDDPAAAGSLDQAPVAVNITTSSASDVLAVPVTALLAQPGGAYAVEVVEPDGTHRLVAVTTGIFDDAQGLVQVSGPQLAAGQSVVVAST